MEKFKPTNSFSWKFALLLFPALVIALAFAGCTKDDLEKLSGSIGDATAVDVSSRITGFDSDITGAGATLTALGSNLSGVKRVIMGGSSSPSVEASESSVVFVVPIDVSLGAQDVFFIFEGNERAKATIEVVSLPVISFISPLAAFSGEEIIILGNNLDIAESVAIGDLPATITEKDKNLLAFTVPAGAVSGSTFTVKSPAGSVSSADLFIACDDEPANVLCLAPVNANGSFEEGDVGRAGDITVPAWGFSGAGSLANFDVISYKDGPTRGGRQALKVEVLAVGANPWNIEVREETFPVAANARYLYTIKVNGPEGSQVDFTVGLPSFSELGRVQATLSGSWEEISFEFTTGPADNMIRTPIHFSRDVNIGRVIYLDDLRIVSLEGDLPCTFENDPDCFCMENPDDPRCGPAPINTNGGFEDSDVGVVGGGMGQITVPNWGFSGTGTLANIEVVDDMVQAGNRALKVEILELGQNPWNIELRQEGIAVEPATTYVYSIWVKGTGGQGHFTVGNPSFNEFGRQEFASFTSDWQEITYEFTTGDMDTELRTPIHLSVAGNVGQVYYIDELKITPK